MIFDYWTIVSIIP